MELRSAAEIRSRTSSGVATSEYEPAAIGVAERAIISARAKHSDVSAHASQS